ncbi:MAG: lytic murein transglycosylase [Candidatus Sungbacteria bacterium]|nr:lytic murein transglycosylase [Candidatus Sungbacteria bacterium]
MWALFKKITPYLFITLVLSVPVFIRAQDNLSPEERSSLTKQLDQLEKEAAGLDQNIQEIQGQARTLKNEIALLDNEIKRRELEIRRLTLVIKQTETDIARKISNIKQTTLKIGVTQRELGAAVKELAQRGGENLLELMLKNQSLSEFFLVLNNNEKLQETIQNKIAELRDYKKSLEQEKIELEDFREGQEAAKAIQEVDKRSLSQKRLERDQLLKLTQGKESLFQELLKKKKTDIATIRGKLFYLESTGISAEDALKYSKLAADRTGIRQAFLLGLLEVETGKQFENGQITVGHNVGKGNWSTDMYQCYINLGKRSTAENQKAAFFKITTALGLDPDKMPVSRRPNYGCGGAMGPAQFIPTTWLLFSNRVASILGKSIANPWNVEDSFTASALFLADAGAKSQTKSGEIAAARTYISGRPNCPAAGSARYACISYANRVYSLSQEIERAL